VAHALDEDDAPAAAEALARLGRLRLERLEAPEAALEAWLQALATGHGDRRLAEETRRLAERLGRPEAEADALEHLVDLASDETEAAATLDALARVYLHRLDAPGRALAAWAAATERDPGCVSAWEGRLELLRSEGAHGEAAAAWRARATAETGAARAQSLLEAAASAWAAGQPEAAVEDLLAARAADRATFEAAGGAERLDEAWAATGAHRARAEARLAAAEGAADPEPLLLEAGELFAEEVGDEAAAERAFRQAFEATGSPRALQRLAEIYTRRGEEEALAALHVDAADRSTDAADRLAHLEAAGGIYEALGAAAEAAEVLARAWEIDPDREAIARRLEALYRQLGRRADLAALLRRRAQRAAGLEQAEALKEAARLHLEAGDEEAALEALHAAEAAAPTDLEVLTELAGLLWAKGEAEAAAARDVRILELQPEAQLAYERLSEWLRATGDLSRLADLTRRRAQAASGRAKAEGLLAAARLFEEAGDLSAARRSALEAFEIAPGDAEAFAVARRILEHAEDPGALADLLEARLSTEKDEAEREALLEALAEARRTAGEPQAARAALDRLLEIRPNDAELWARGAAWAAEESDEAAEPYDRRLVALASAGETVEASALFAAYERLARLSRTRADAAASVRHLEEAIALLDPEDPSLEALAGQLLEAAQEASDARACARAHRLLLERAPAEARFERLAPAARAHAAAGEIEEACRLYGEILERDPGNEEAFDALDELEEDPRLRVERALRFAEATDDAGRRRAVLEATAARAKEAGLEAEANRAALLAWQAGAESPSVAEQALGALRDQQGPSAVADLLRALRVLAEAAGPGEEAIAYLLEAIERQREAGEEGEAAHDLEVALLTAAEAAPRLSAPVARRLVAEIRRLREGEEEAARRRALLELEARFTEGAERGQVLFDLAAVSRGAEALEALAEAAELCPEDPEVWSVLARRATDEGEMDLAARAATHLLERDGAEAEAVAQAVLDAAEASEQLERAESIAEALTRHRPGDPELWSRLASLREARSAGSEAADAAWRAYEAGKAAEEPASVLARRAGRAARAFLEVGATEEARRAFEAVLAHDPQDGEAIAWLEAALSASEGEAAVARLHLERAERLLQADAKESAAQAFLAASERWEAADDLERAREAAEAALHHRPGAPEALARLKALARATGDVEAERRALRAEMTEASDARQRAEAARALARLETAEEALAEAAAAWRVALAAAETAAQTDHGAEEGAREPGAMPAWAASILREGGVRLGETLLTLGQAEEARAHLSRAVAAGAEGEAHRLLARACAQCGDVAGAREAYEAALARDPADEGALEGLLELARSTGDGALELTVLERRAKHAAEPEAALRALATRAEALGDEAAAQAAWAALFDRDPGAGEAFDALARAARAGGDRPRLASLLERRVEAVEDGEAAAELLHELAVLRREGSDEAGAREALERALARCPDHAPSRLALARWLDAAGRHDEARAHYEVLYQQDSPYRPPVALRLGTLALERDRPEKALEYFQAAAEADPASEEAWEGLRRAAAALGRHALHAQALERLLERREAEAPEQPEATVDLRLELAEVEKRRLRTDAAVAHYEAVRALCPERMEVVEALAQLYEQQQRWHAVREALETLVCQATEPDVEADLLVKLGRLLTDRLADPDAALPYLERAVAADPDHRDAWRLRFELLAPRGPSPELAIAARRLVELGEDAVLAPWALEVGRALAAAGEYRLAAEWLERAAAQRPDDLDLLGEVATACALAGRHEAAQRYLTERAERTGAPAHFRDAAEASLAAGDAQAYVDLMWRGLEDPEMDRAMRRTAAQGLAEVMAHRLGRPGAAAEALAPFCAAAPEDRPLQRQRAELLRLAGSLDEALSVWVDLLRTDPTDRRALASALAVLESRDPDRHRWLRGLEAFLSGEAISVPPVDPQALHIDPLTRLEVADPVATEAVASYLREMAPYFEPLFPSDLSRFGVRPEDALTPEADPVVAKLERWVRLFTERPFRAYRSQRLGFAAHIENTEPASLVLGGTLLDAPERLQAPVFAGLGELLAAGYALPGRFSDADTAILVRLVVAFYVPQVEVPIPPSRLGQYHELLEARVPRARSEPLRELAHRAAEALGDLQASALVAALRRSAWRFALLLTGDVVATLEAAMRAVGDAGAPEAALKTNPLLFDLARFLLREDIAALYAASHPGT
ncbi:MAG: hypothetical protein D6729_10400, partial [Deltaproteobacteria bacterium]